MHAHFNFQLLIDNALQTAQSLHILMPNAHAHVHVHWACSVVKSIDNSYIACISAMTIDVYVYVHTIITYMCGILQNVAKMLVSW